MINIKSLFILFFILTNQSAYNPITREVIYCTNRYNCIHEQGHVIDHGNGWVSLSDEWKNAVDIYRRVLWLNPEQRDEHSDRIYNFPGVGSQKTPCSPSSICFYQGGWGDYTELYADIWAMYDGNPPDCFKEFYYDNKIKK